MAISQQYLHQLNIYRLKNLNDLELPFDGAPVTAILGPNGNGKSTVLHALACAFKPISEGEDYQFSTFFRPNTDALWSGSHLDIIHTYRDGVNLHQRVTRKYKKTTDRWTPRYGDRPSREIYYVGIDKCVPLIEAEKRPTRINYLTEANKEEVVTKILEKASYILNRAYTAYNIHTASGKKFIGVQTNEMQYSALSMSAGEQKIFYILERLFKAAKYSLLLIDELDLLLHDNALRRLIKVINQRASDKNLQVIFTTHRESVLGEEQTINVRHIVAAASRSLCFCETKPDAINRLTGSQPRPIELFVEDDLASTIVKKLASQLGGAKYISIHQFGAAINCFTTVAGLLLSGDSCARALFILDGDVHKTQEDKIEKIKKVIAGDDPVLERIRNEAMSKIVQFSLPDGLNPEQYIHSILGATPGGIDPEINEVLAAAREIVGVADTHDYLNDLMERIGWDRPNGLSKIVDIIAQTEAWESYIQPVREWLREQILECREVPVALQVCDNRGQTPVFERYA